MSDKIVKVESAEQLIQLFGQPRPPSEDYGLIALINWLNTPENHEPDPEL